MDLLVVGCGRDGTTSVTALLRALYKANEKKQLEDMSIARHESNNIELYRGVMEYIRSERYDLVKNVLLGMRHLFECGNGYSFIMPIVREVLGPVKLVLLIREEKAHIASLLRRPQLNPQNWGGYVSIKNPAIFRPTAVDFLEMSAQAWWSMTLKDRISWYREKSLALVRSHSKLFPSYLELRTESLCDAHEIGRLASFINSAWLSDVELFHVGSSAPVDYAGTQKDEIRKLEAEWRSINFASPLRAKVDLSTL